MRGDAMVAYSKRARLVGDAWAGPVDPLPPPVQNTEEKYKLPHMIYLYQSPRSMVYIRILKVFIRIYEVKNGKERMSRLYPSIAQAKYAFEQGIIRWID